MLGLSLDFLIALLMISSKALYCGAAQIVVAVIFLYDVFFVTCSKRKKG